MLLTIFIYQLSLPIPSDLLLTTKHYLQMATNREVAWAWTVKDVLSYTVFNGLCYLFPNSPITFYGVNLFMVFAGLFIVYQNESKAISSPALLLAIFLGVVDFETSHHYLRQTTAFVLFICSFYLSRKLQILMIFVSVLWHGSALILLPSLLIYKIINNEKKGFLITFIILVGAAVLAKINIYEIIPVSEPANDIFKTPYYDRFIRYFTDPRYSTYFNQSRELGNPTINLYVGILIFTVAHGFWKKQVKTWLISLTITLGFFFIIFQHHVLLYPRIIYAFEMILFFYWYLCLVKTKLFCEKLKPLIVITTVFLKFHFFFWPLDTKAHDKYLYLSHPFTLLEDYDRWDININYYQNLKR